MRRRIICVLLTLVLLLAFSCPAMAYDSPAGAVRSIQEVMEYIYLNHIDKPGLDWLTDGAINGMLESLDDPYSEYLSPDKLEEYKEMLDGDFVGVGLHLQALDPYPVVLEVIQGSPASRSDIKPGDFIVKVGGEDVAGLTLDAIVEKIRGPEGTAVKITVRRGAGQLEVEIKRAALSSPTVESARLAGDIGYIAIHSFGSRTAEQFASVLEGQAFAGVKGLILDLRDSPGGYLQEAIDIAGNFLKDKTLVVTIVNNDSSREEYRSQGSPRLDSLPLAVLINSQSASSAEVLAGALQDHGRATLVGDVSYGKGVVQSIIPLENGGALKLTTARYFTPNGRSIDGVGLNPDVPVSTRDLQLPVAIGMVNSAGESVLRFKLNEDMVMVNGEKTNFYARPYQSGGVVYVPLRLTMEALGYAVDWNSEKQGIEIRDREEKIFIPAGKLTASVNNSAVYLKSQVQLKNGISYFPLDAAHLIGATVLEQGDEITVAKIRRK